MSTEAGKRMDLDFWDVVKIVTTIAGVVVIWIYKRQIASLIGSLIVGDAYEETKGKSNSEILEEIEEIMGRVLK